jgi:hypothetical protein
VREGEFLVHEGRVPAADITPPSTRTVRPE